MEIILITGLSLSLIAIGILYYLGYKQNIFIQKRCNKLGAALLALQNEFSQYQVNQARHSEKETAKREIRFDNIARSIKKNEEAIYSISKNIPNEIRKTVGHIEFARPLDKK